MAIKLKDILEMDNLVYSDTIKKKHQIKMDNSDGIFTGFDTNQFKSFPPKKPSSPSMIGELMDLEDIVSDVNVHKPDKIENYFKTYLKDYDLAYPKKLDTILDDSRGIVLRLKYYYNRPRPAQVAKAYGLKFHEEPLDSAHTPSYPSGHAVQGRLAARFLSDIYPDHAENLMKLGDDIATSRLIAKVHFISDSTFGTEIGDSLFNFLEKNNDKS
jgi:hypothetical protein